MQFFVFTGFISVASISNGRTTLVIDCLFSDDLDFIIGAIKSLMEDPTKIKILQGGHNDILRIRKDWGVYPLTIIDIQNVFRQWRKMEGTFEEAKPLLLERAAKNKKSTAESDLREAFANYANPGLDFLIELTCVPAKKDKNLTTSNWTLRPLTKKMLEYSAQDAHATLLVFQRFANQVRL